MSYTIKNLESVDDIAPKHGLEEFGEARFAREHLNATQTGVAHQRLRPNKRQQFGHRHESAEEIYVVLSGSGRIRLDDDIHPIGRLDAIRVAPETMRAFEAGTDGLELLVFGPHVENDGSMVPGWWND